MGLRFDPVGGGQFKSALKKIIEVERQPIKNLQARKTIEDAKLKLFQEFKAKFTGVDSSLSELTNFKKFREFKVELGDGEKLISVTVDKDKAESGTYEIQVDQLAKRTSAITNGFEDPDSPLVGMGFIVLDRPDGEEWEVFIDEHQSSLNGIATLINQDKRAPIRAAVVKDAYDPDRPWKMILTAKNDGLDDEIIFPQFYFLDGEEDFYLDDDREAQNARLSIDGFPIDTESNQVPDFLPGINILLKQAREDEPFFMTITEDFQKISGKMKSLVEKLNGILEFIYKQNAIDDSTDTRGTFAGDSGLQIMEHKIRNILHEGYPVWGTSEDDESFSLIQMGQLGLEFGRNGLLSFNEKKFETGMEKDFLIVAEAVTGVDGFANRLKEALATYTRTADGLLIHKEHALKSRIRQIDTQIENKERILARREQSLTEQFSRLQASIGALQRQQQYLAATLPGAGGGSDLLGQLLASGG